jgi:CheY-like chemotaxis protein
MQDAPCILVVDDHREIRELVSRALAKEGFRVSTAADGRAMHKVLADSRVDLILLDLMLPGEDGLSLCRRLRAESDIPIIMLTAKGDEVDRVIGLERGADDYLPKPFGSRELIARIKAVLRRGRRERAIIDQSGRPRRYRFDRWILDTGARARVTLQAGEKLVEIVIEDEGPGIPEEELTRVFQPFYRVEQSRNRESGGVGLGLAIAQSLVQKNNGTLSLQNRPSGGLRAQILLSKSV